MARHDVLSKVPAASLGEVNAFMIGLFGDDPGSQEIELNAYVDGDDPTVATMSIGVANCSQSDTDSLVSYLAAITDCDSKVYETAGSASDFWADALELWSLRPMTPSVR